MDTNEPVVVEEPAAELTADAADAPTLTEASRTDLDRLRQGHPEVSPSPTGETLRVAAGDLDAAVDTLLEQLEDLLERYVPARNRPTNAIAAVLRAQKRLGRA